jgi:Protein of unknown function (DUF1579)
MNCTSARLALRAGTLVITVVLPALAAAQDMPLPKPGPEHEVLKQDEGAWDATVEIFAQPGAAPMTSKGVETNTIGCSGLCLITDFKGDMMPGVPFHGHGTTVFDAAKKKYVGSWTDSMSTGIAIGESTYDAAAKTLTGWVEAPDPSGNVARMRQVVEYKGDTRVATMFAPGPDGKEVMSMRITYARKK